jgi:hypothetical protein
MPKKSGTGNPADLIKMAIDGLDVQIKEWTDKREQLAKMIDGAAAAGVRRRGRPAGTTAASNKPKRVVSEATKRKLRAAAKARWARERGESE